jgi:hypothetical protein
MDAVVIKKCCVCGVDVSRMRRTRDPRGKYYCQPCYQTLWEAHQRRLRERAALDAEATAAALLMERAVEAAAAAAANTASTSQPAVVAKTFEVEPHGALASPQFEIKALPAEPAQADSLQRAFSLGRALSRAATALASLRPASDQMDGTVVPVTARRVKRDRSRNELRLSDLIGQEAQSAVDGSRPRFHEPEVPVSPITNPPVSAFVEDYAALVEPREPVFAVPDTSLS